MVRGNLRMAKCHLLLHSLLILSCYHIHCEAKETTNRHHYGIQRKLLDPSSISTCKGQQLKGLRISQRYGPCSPISQGSPSPTSQQILLQDQCRVRSINSAAANRYALDDHGEGTRLPLFGRSIGAGNYVVTVGLGTPRQDLNLIFDTGSEITWVKCRPGSNFNPFASSTFSNATCSTSKCDYSVKYLDKSYSEGYFGRDTLIITSSDTFPNFAFGCGQNNSDDFGSAAGVLGLGQAGSLSLISQTAVDFAQVFCYCLPAAAASSGYLLFGLEALETCQTGKGTRLTRDPNRPALYFVNLVGITIGGQKLAISSGSSSSPRTIMDSGTVITRLPSSVYVGLRSAFRNSMSKYPVAMPLPPLLETCYNLEGYSNVTIPPVVLQFEGINVALDPTAVVWRENGDSRVCLAFAPNTDASELTIIGNHQQRTLNVLYDIQERKVEFGTGSCGN